MELTDNLSFVAVSDKYLHNSHMSKKDHTLVCYVSKGTLTFSFCLYKKHNLELPSPLKCHICRLYSDLLPYLHSLFRCSRIPCSGSLLNTGFQFERKGSGNQTGLVHKRAVRLYCCFFHNGTLYILCQLYMLKLKNK